MTAAREPVASGMCRARTATTMVTDSAMTDPQRSREIHRTVTAGSDTDGPVTRERGTTIAGNIGTLIASERG